MAEEIDDGEFYREDFSIESNWEVLNAQLTELLEKWKLNIDQLEIGREFEDDELFSCEWQVETELLALEGHEICASYYAAKLNEENPTKDELSEKGEEYVADFHADLMSFKNSFGPPVSNASNNNLHTLARVYGLRRFVVLHPCQPKHFFKTTKEFSFFLSSANVAAAESTVPIFVQIYDPKWNYYIGVGMAPTLRTHFDLVAMEQAPLELKYLAGLLSLFKDKLSVTYIQPATVSVSLTYLLQKQDIRLPMHVPFARSTYEDEFALTPLSKLDSSLFIALPHGYFPSSCAFINCVFTWPELSENMAIDSSLRSDFLPSRAHQTSTYFTVQATSYLSTSVRDYVRLSGSASTVEQYVGRNFSGTASGAERGALDALTQPQLRSLHTLKQIRLKTEGGLRKLLGPMNESEINEMMTYLFPDMHPEQALFPYSPIIESSVQNIKTATADSLVHRLCCLLTTVNAHFGGKAGLAQLWAAFIRELRFKWDFCSSIQGIAAGFPNTHTCLLHQKLQMLNVCMERCALREGQLKSKQTTAILTDDEDENITEEEDNDDEFYDCSNDEDDENEPSKTTLQDGKTKAEGRKKKLGDLKLLKTEEPLYIPVTQEPVPKTEDELLDDAETMLKMAETGEGTSSQLMFPSLLSDMQAFKAANPQAQMEDFIRWYSPKDWIESKNEEGQLVQKLSERMSAPDNTWQNMWSQAQAVPAWRQKRLFDDTKEALKVLQFLESRSIGDIYELTVLPMLHAAVLKLEDFANNSKTLQILTSDIQALLLDLNQLSRDFEHHVQSDHTSELPSIEWFIKKLEKLEEQIYAYKSIEDSEHEEMLRNVLAAGGACKTNITKIKVHEENLISKDYIIRVHGETTSTSNGKAGPQFLRAIVTGEKLRLCGAFTENTVFV